MNNERLRCWHHTLKKLAAGHTEMSSRLSEGQDAITKLFTYMSSNKPYLFQLYHQLRTKNIKFMCIHIHEFSDII